MLSEHAGQVTILRENRLASVQKEGRRVRSIKLDQAPVDSRGAPSPDPLQRSGVSISAAMFIDASYEGDLMAASGVSHRSDRESRAEYGESYAGVRPDFSGPEVDPYRRPGDVSSGLIPLISTEPMGATGSGSPLIQAYNFRLCLTRNNPIPIEPSADYHPGTYEIFARKLAAEAIAGIPLKAREMHKSTHGRFLRFEVMPNGKTDVNNAGSFSTDFVTGGPRYYAGGSWSDRAKLWHAHEDYLRGLYYFLMTDPRVSEEIRTDLRQWGLARDEFKDSRGWPTQLYIRESRRMLGRYVMHQADCERASARLEDGVGVGTYSLDSHQANRVAFFGRVVDEGGFWGPLPGIFPIPYRVLTPVAEECENLLVTFCLSATHVSFSSPTHGAVVHGAERKRGHRRPPLSGREHKRPEHRHPALQEAASRCRPNHFGVRGSRARSDRAAISVYEGSSRTRGRCFCFRSRAELHCAIKFAPTWIRKRRSGD